jgi:hypothetical protein
VKEIGWEAFGGCTSLKDIHSRIDNLDNIVISDYAFKGLNKNECTLYVPPGTRWAYRHHKVFGVFKKMEINETCRDNEK